MKIFDQSDNTNRHIFSDQISCIVDDNNEVYVYFNNIDTYPCVLISKINGVPKIQIIQKGISKKQYHAHLVKSYQYINEKWNLVKTKIIDFLKYDKIK